MLSNRTADRVEKEQIDQFVSKIDDMESIVSWKVRDSVVVNLKSEINQTKSKDIAPEDRINLEGKLTE